MPNEPANKGKYFSEAGAAERARLRTEAGVAAQRLRDRDAIASELSLDDPELVERIHALGFDGESVRVFDLLPLIHVAWADGRIQRDERAMIFGLLEERGFSPGSGPFVFLEALLESRPSESFMAESLSLLQALLPDQPGAAADVVDLCLRVADASGGLLGLGNKTSPEERALIEKIATVLGDDARQRFSESWRQASS